MTEEKTTAITKPSGRMKITQFIERKSAATGAAQAQGQFGGHHFFCSRCSGFRTHHVTLGSDRKLTLECSGCQKKSVLVRQGGVWVPEHLAETLRAYIPVRTEQVILDYLSKRESPTPIPEPGFVERSKGAVSKLFPALEHITHREVDEALADVEETPRIRDSQISGLPSPGSTESEPARKPRSEPKPEPEPEKAEPRIPSRTRAKAAVVAVSAPFLLMGTLYALAWRGYYVWPIYYAIQPYYQGWMNEWWFASLSLIVPAIAAAAYAIRFRGQGQDIIDWEPEV